mgnify:CR=1 FL=1
MAWRSRGDWSERSDRGGSRSSGSAWTGKTARGRDGSERQWKWSRTSNQGNHWRDAGFTSDHTDYRSKDQAAKRARHGSGGRGWVSDTPQRERTVDAMNAIACELVEKILDKEVSTDDFAGYFRPACRTLPVSYTHLTLPTTPYV